MNYEIINIRVEKNEVWADLLDKNRERLQQLTKIAPLKDILVYLNERMLSEKNS